MKSGKECRETWKQGKQIFRVPLGNVYPKFKDLESQKLRRKIQIHGEVVHFARSGNFLFYVFGPNEHDRESLKALRVVSRMPP